MSRAEVTPLREKILRLAREIEASSESDVTPDRFFPAFVAKLAEATGAHAAAVWIGDPTTRPTFQVGLAEAGFFDAPEAGRRMEPLLNEVFQTGESAVLHPDDKPLPTRHVYVLAALQVASDPIGAVAVLQRPEMPAAARGGVLQFVEQMAGYASRYLTRRNAPPPADGHAPVPKAAGPAAAPSGRPAPAAGAAPAAAGLTPAFWTSLEKFLLQLERSRTVAEVASTAASDGRLVFGIDRVSLARKRGRKVVIEAVSGQEKVNPRANLVRHMSDLCRTVMDGREPLVYTGNVEGLPPQVERPLAEFVAESKSRLAIVVPLFETDELVRPEHEEKEPDRNKREARVIGALVAEQINDSRMPPALREKVDIVADHVAASLQQSIAFERIFLRRTLQTIGKTKEWFHGRKLAKTIAIASAVAAVVLTMWLVPYPYRVTAEGRLMPVTQRDVFAPADGDVTELFVRGGEQVSAGTRLAVLRDDELRSELVRVRKELDETRQMLIGLAAQIGEAQTRGADDELFQLEGERVAALAQIDGSEAQLAILREREARLEVTAPIDGVVATFQLDRLLRNRPVRRGESLMEVMDASGDWHLEIDVEDKRMGHLRDAARERGDDRLPVEFVLATDPETTFAGSVKQVASRAEVDAEKGNVVQVEAAIADLDALPRRRIGAEVRARVDCGPAPLGYVLFGDVIEFVRVHLWRWL